MGQTKNYGSESLQMAISQANNTKNNSTEKN